MTSTFHQRHRRQHLPVAVATSATALGRTGASGTTRWNNSNNSSERCINRLKQWRGIATRCEKTASIYLAGLHIAGIFLWSAR
ncbi:hypothetical protein ACWD0A_12615 [Streptomyces sp. NPDC002867]